jgi:hypothetical protein
VKYVPNEYTGKSLMMGKKKMMYGGMSKKKMMGGGMSRKTMMGGSRMGYKHGGHATIQDMERACSAMTMTESAKGRKLK